jgi:hypothetical protein
MASTDIMRKICFIIGSDILLVFADQASPGSMMHPTAGKNQPTHPWARQSIKNCIYKVLIGTTSSAIETDATILHSPGYCNPNKTRSCKLD